MSRTIQFSLLALSWTANQFAPVFGELECSHHYFNYYCAFPHNRENMDPVHPIYKANATHPLLDEIWIGFDASADSQFLFRDDDEIAALCSGYSSQPEHEWTVSDDRQWEVDEYNKRVPPSRDQCTEFGPDGKSKGVLHEILERYVESEFGWIIRDDCKGTAGCPAVEIEGNSTYRINATALSGSGSFCAYHTFRKCIQTFIPTSSPTVTPSSAPSNAPTGSPVLVGPPTEFPTELPTPLVGPPTEFPTELPTPLAVPP